MKAKWVVLILVAAGVIAMVLWMKSRPDATVAVVQPTRQAVRAYVEEQAVTELPHDYLISMPISGWLEPIMLREGDTVAKDQVVARLEMDDLRDRVVQAQQRIGELETKLAETADHRLEKNALVEVEATVKAIDHTVEASEAKLEAAKAILDFATSELKRLKQMGEAEAAAGQEMRRAEMEFRKARADYQSDLLETAALKTVAAVSYIGPKFINDYIDRKSFTSETYTKQLEQARAELEIAKRNLARAEVRSPIDGVVLNRLQTRRQFLAAGTPLLTIGRLEDMEVIAEILTERATAIQPGQAVEISGRALSDGPIPGKVLRVYPAGFKKISSLGVEQQRVNVAVKLDKRPERLGVAFRVYVRIFYAEAPDALTLPRTCLVRSAAGGWEVMTVRNGRTAAQKVEVGLMNDDVAQITSGLNPDEQVVARPAREIKSGMRVRISP
jgi:HlyD family secretion protein